MELRKREDGFTLIELMVVVMIIAILIAIAVPTFLNVRKKAQDRQAESSLRNAYTEAKALYTDAQDWASASVAGMTAAEPALTFQAAASTGPKIISLSSASTGVVMAAKSGSGTCFVIRELANQATQYGTGSCNAASVGSVTFDTDPTTGGW